MIRTYNFQKRFREPIVNGSKTQTIRKPRKHETKPDDTLHLYRHADKAMPANCKGDLRKRNNYTDLSVPKKISSKHHYEHFSIRDGFDNIDDFYEFFQQYGEEKLSMEIIYWRLR